MPKYLHSESKSHNASQLQTPIQVENMLTDLGTMKDQHQATGKAWQRISRTQESSHIKQQVFIVMRRLRDVLKRTLWLSPKASLLFFSILRLDMRDERFLNIKLYDDQRYLLKRCLLLRMRKINCLKHYPDENCYSESESPFLILLSWPDFMCLRLYSWLIEVHRYQITNDTRSADRNSVAFSRTQLQHTCTTSHSSLCHGFFSWLEGIQGCKKTWVFVSC